MLTVGQDSVTRSDSVEFVSFSYFSVWMEPICVLKLLKEQTWGSFTAKQSQGKHVHELLIKVSFSF